MAYKIPISVLVVIHTRALDVLLLERADRPGFWQSVTGSMHEGESLQSTAVREVREETGIDASAFPLLDWRVQNRFEIFRRWSSRFEPGVTHNSERVFGLTLPERMYGSVSVTTVDTSGTRPGSRSWIAGPPPL